ncbi:hypothetical protein FNF28_00741 [Cafeteria roenbergensis]|uniref:Uncharacterized protein n=1 Tax=Cafeteria roenbergensis TaxID=33653 RepID=A0A5A8E6R6_CAFRO|nr:hypothetical protein FNF28_00741 [Cafeteria roenbergensis]
MIMQMKLSHASAAGDAAAVAEILDAGANSGTPDLAGLTPLHHAATNGEPAVIELLVARGASPDTPAANAAGGTPLHCAAGNGQDGACACLLRLGADPSLRNLKGHLPEDLARAFGAAGVLRMLARARQDADAAAAAEAEEGRSDGNSDQGRDGRVSAVSVSRFALLQPLQHLFRCVLPPKLARLEGRVVAAVGSASLDDALAVHPHVLRRKLKALGVRKKDRDAIVAGMRPLRDAAGHGEGARPYLQAVAAAEQAGLP